ncbi:MAG: tetratricopeptide repeat-containing sensor histidine kinase [Aquaticitalea sp.]
MKAYRLPFLYFLLICHILSSSVVNAQDDTDSLKYYYKLLKNPERPTDLANSYIFFQKNLKNNLDAKDTVAAISDLRYIASIENNLGFLYDSEKTVVRALQLLKHQKGQDKNNAMTGLYNQLGMIHREFYNYDKALAFYDKALETCNNGRDSTIVINNVAYTHMEEGDYQLASEKFERVYRNSLKINDSLAIARALDNLGYVKSKLNDSEGLQNMLEALAMREDLEDTKGLYSSYKNLSLYYFEQNHLDKALTYAQSAYNLAKSINSVIYVEDALSNLISLKTDVHVLEYKSIRDSIAKSKQLQENKFAEMKYNNSEYQRQAQESELAASKQRTKTLAYQFVGLILLLIGFFFYIILRTRHKKENFLKVYETETRISKKLHDEVANDIYKMMTQLQDRSNSKEPFVDELEAIYIKTRDISKENSDVSHTDYKMQLEDLITAYQNDETNIILKDFKSIDWKAVLDIKRTAVYRVLQELMTNMKKHSKASLVVLTFKQEHNKLYITYKDNGIGTDLHKGSGCRNMENRIEAVNGTINFESQINSGFKVTIII